MNQGFPFDCTQHGLRCHNKMCIDVTIFPSDRNFVILSWDIHVAAEGRSRFSRQTISQMQSMYTTFKKYIVYYKYICAIVPVV